MKIKCKMLFKDINRRPPPHFTNEINGNKEEI